eukprot:6461591-Pyramimonas_sp.AAC.1
MPHFLTRWVHIDRIQSVNGFVESVDGDGMRMQLEVSPVAQAYVAGLTFALAASPCRCVRVDFKGYSVDAKGYRVDVKGYSMDAKGYQVDVKGYRAGAKGYERPGSALLPTNATLIYSYLF